MSKDVKKREIVEAVAVHQETFCRMSDAIWSYAELPLEEHKSAELVARTLETNGFEVQRGVAGLPTAIVARWSNGTGKPVIGLMGEYDALPMLSQKAGIARQDPLVPGAPGHGCSHNTMCAVQGLAAVSLKEIMQKYGIDGTIKLFGCPGEEILISRPYMIRAGLFDDVDAVIDCHGEDSLKIPVGTEGTACISFMVTFRGKTAHSGSSPWKGRSAADAVELMHAGTERMREHLPITQRSHWVTLEGGEAPNVVPDRASTWYYVRDVDENIQENFEWFRDCAEGAALMTQTTHEIRVLGAVHQRFHNTALAELIFENMKVVKLPEYSAEEEVYAAEIQNTLGFPRKGMAYTPEIVRTQMAPPQKGGSSDVGDVTLIAPTATVKYPVRVPGSYSHHWSVTSAASGSISRKGIVTGATVVAFSAFDLLTNPAVFGKIRSEFEALSKERPYRSFLPDDAEPPFGINAAIQEKYRSAMEKFYIAP
jgi:aminobenzoyl-glutamate utilization protein B